jgi:hypothetical protein
VLGMTLARYQQGERKFLQLIDYSVPITAQQVDEFKSFMGKTLAMWRLQNAYQGDMVCNRGDCCAQMRDTYVKMGVLCARYAEVSTALGEPGWPGWGNYFAPLVVVGNNQVVPAARPSGGGMEAVEPDDEEYDERMSVFTEEVRRSIELVEKWLSGNGKEAVENADDEGGERMSVVMEDVDESMEDVDESMEEVDESIEEVGRGVSGGRGREAIRRHTSNALSRMEHTASTHEARARRRDWSRSLNRWRNRIASMK